MCRSFLAAALLVCGSSQAADWVSLGKSKSGIDEHELLGDTSSIRLSGEVTLPHIHIDQEFII
jgi:hypothetical protein